MAARGAPEVSKQTLILACSARKLDTPARAVDIYQGALFRMGKEYAEQRGMKIVILSALYGLLEADQVIEPYNLKMQKTYEGEWPQGFGYYLGGSLYFANAPSRFVRLVPFGRIGKMLGYMKQLNAGVPRPDVFANAGPP